MGGGGCMAHALAELGVFESMEQAKATLNALIDIKHAQLRRHDPDCPRALAGVEDDAWHPSLVADVVKARGFHFKKLTPQQHTNLAAVLSRGGSFVVDGVLNKYYKGSDGHMLTSDPDDPTHPARQPEQWRHAIPVVNGVIREQAEQEIPVTCLHLGFDGRPNLRHGYMREICKVYKVYKCTGSEGCRGECA